jgi:regulator of replication initiation timing
MSLSTAILFFTAIGIAFGLVWFVFNHVRELEMSISRLQAAGMTLESTLQTVKQENADLLSEVDSLNEQLAELLQPKPVSGPARFPISRVLARQGDTVSKLAQREGTSSEVIQALNPWLQGTTDLIASQAIWIPNPEQ